MPPAVRLEEGGGRCIRPSCGTVNSLLPLRSHLDTPRSVTVRLGHPAMSAQLVHDGLVLVRLLLKQLSAPPSRHALDFAACRRFCFPHGQVIDASAGVRTPLARDPAQVLRLPVRAPIVRQRRCGPWRRRRATSHRLGQLVHDGARREANSAGQLSTRRSRLLRQAEEESARSPQELLARIRIRLKEDVDLRPQTAAVVIRARLCTAVSCQNPPRDTSPVRQGSTLCRVGRQAHRVSARRERFLGKVRAVARASPRAIAAIGADTAEFSRLARARGRPRPARAFGEQCRIKAARTAYRQSPRRQRPVKPSVRAAQAEGVRLCVVHLFIARSLAATARPPLASHRVLMRGAALPSSPCRSLFIT